MVLHHGTDRANKAALGDKNPKFFQWLVSARGRIQRLIPSKLAAIPRWNSDQSKPSASAR
jgi:hypothetical protein